MKSAPFVRHVPKTVDEAIGMLAEFGPEDGRVLAGGQSLVPIMAFRLARPAHLIDINKVAELARQSSDGKILSIGAVVRHAAFHRPVVDAAMGRLLATVVRHIAHYPIRMRGTFCGSIAHADPASEWCLVAATLGAEMVATSKRGKRVDRRQRFFRRHHVDGAGRGRAADRGAPADRFRPTPASASTSSAAGPAISPLRRRW